jgi:hypothetical protein
VAHVNMCTASGIQAAVVHTINSFNVTGNHAVWVYQLADCEYTLGDKFGIGIPGSATNG